MTDYRKLQARCQRGKPNAHEANNLLAECHAALGKLIAENEALRNAMVQIIEMNRMHAECQYGDPDKAETWSCVTVAREALSVGDHL
jgi:hypothetical protein